MKTLSSRPTPVVKQQAQSTLTLMNCTIAIRSTDPCMFVVTGDGAVHVHIDGYAIIPIEDYDALKGQP